MMSLNNIGLLHDVILELEAYLILEVESGA